MKRNCVFRRANLVTFTGDQVKLSVTVNDVIDVIELTRRVFIFITGLSLHSDIFQGTKKERKKELQNSDIS